MYDVAVCIPSIPQRKAKLRKAVSSVLAQNYPVANISIAVDHWQDGSAITRNRALHAIHNEFTVFLDDDDQLLSTAVRDFVMAHVDTGADVIYGLPRIVDAQGNVRPRFFEAGGPDTFDPDLLRQKSYIPVVSMVRTELAQSSGGFQFKQDTHGTYDDWGFYNRMLDAGAIFHHILTETFIWNVDGGNTSGQPNRGDARGT